LLGPSGCGKTTILRLLLGLDRDYEGELLCGGAPIIGPGSERGVVFQEPRLLPWMSVQKNVEFGLERGARRGAQGRQRARDAVSLVGLKGFENRWPRELSGGWRSERLWRAPW
jgi:ABC-type nitrate/sulfonate/bicarbonate transport system ATPase subunit